MIQTANIIISRQFNNIAMCALDIILVACLALAAVQGVMKGFTEQIIALVSIFVGAWAAFRFSGPVCTWAQPYLQISGRILRVAVFILMVILIAVALRLVGKVIKASIKFIMLGWLDRLLGAVFAVAKAGLVIGILIILFNSVNTEYKFVDSATLEKSRLYGPMKTMAYDIFPYFKDLLNK